MADRYFRNHIGGRDLEAVSGERAELIDPATARPNGSAPVSGAADVDMACDRAAEALVDWAATTPRRRQEALLALATLIEAHAPEFTEAEVADTGKPLRLFESDELPAIIDTLRFFAGAARTLPGAAVGEYAEGFTSMLRREPIGVCAQITPWNYPLMMAVWKVAPALATGNTVVLKPADTTPSSALLLARLGSEVLPPGVLNVVCGGRDTGRLLVEHPVPAMVAITGSLRAGREVARSAAGDVKRLHLELGGNAPAIVHSDADLDEAAAALAEVGYYNAGQDCTAPSRILVDQAVHDRFVVALAEAVAKVETGSPDDPGVHYGPLNNAAQRDSVRLLLNGLPSHATLLGGEGALESAGYYLAPSVVVDAGQSDAIIQQEIFGPVLTVQRFRGEEESLRLANGTPYGLGASVWTRNHERAMRAARSLRTGIVWINTHGTTVAEMPHGGVGHSGHGSDLSLQSLLEYTHPKHVLSRL